MKSGSFVSVTKDTCPACKEYDYFKVTTSLEDTDADGNRGRWMGTIECRNCGYEESHYLNG